MNNHTFLGCLYFVRAIHCEGKCKCVPCVPCLNASVYRRMNNAALCRFKLCKILFSNFLFLSESFAGSEGVQLQGVVKRFTGTVSNLVTAVTLQILLYLAFRVV